MKSSSTKRNVMNGSAGKTSGGLTKSDLKKTKSGKIVSKKKSRIVLKNFGGWLDAVKKAKKSLGIPVKKFVLLKKSSPLYKKAASIYYGKSGAKKSGAKKSGAKKSRKCRYGKKKSGACKKKSDVKKSGAKKSGAKKSRKCRYGKKKSGACKKKSGPKKM